MKKTILLYIAVLFTGITQAQFSGAELKAIGLTCSMCSNAILSALKEIQDIDKVEADIKNSTYKIEFKNGKAPIDEMKSAVEDAGFFVGELALKGTFENVDVENDAHVTIDNKVFHFVDVKKQALSGNKVIRLVDKNFITEKEFKKISKATKMSCIKTGTAAGCCTESGITAGARIYHVTL